MVVMTIKKILFKQLCICRGSPFQGVKIAIPTIGGAFGKEIKPPDTADFSCRWTNKKSVSLAPTLETIGAERSNFHTVDFVVYNLTDEFTRGWSQT